MHIALDAMGGDLGPGELVAGAVEAVETSNLQVTLFGDEKVLYSHLKKSGRANSDKLHIHHTTEVIDMAESPIDAIRRKRDASVVVAFERAKAGEVNAVVSAGNSGATMASAVRALGRLPGISRPGIASLFPTLKNPVVMMDVGANVDCRPQHLFQFGVMAASFSEVILGIAQPRVGILSIGEEEGKGNTLVRKTADLFRKSSLNFIGNIEGSDTFSGDVDVIVCDGFVGNVCLKISEGLADALTKMLRAEINKNPLAILGYFLSRRSFKSFKKRVDYANYGGAPLLGLKGTGIVCHGRSNSRAIKNAIAVAADLVENKVNDRILQLLPEKGKSNGAEPEIDENKTAGTN